MTQFVAPIAFVQPFPPPAQASAVQASPSSQLVAQQMLPLALDTQCPFVHWLSAVQVEPLVFFSQRLLLLQLYPLVVSQLELVVQEVAHFPDTHRYPVPQA